MSTAPLTPEQRSERARLGGLARAERLSPERRKELSRTAHLGSAVSSVVNRAPELTAEQRDRLLVALRPHTARPHRRPDGVA